MKSPCFHKSSFNINIAQNYALLNKKMILLCYAQTIDTDNPWIGQTLYDSQLAQLQHTCPRHIRGRPRLTRLCCDLPTHIHWRYQKKNQARTLPPSFVVNNNCYFILNWSYLYESIHSRMVTQKAEAKKNCIHIEEVAFAATIKLCCT